MNIFIYCAFIWLLGGFVTGLTSFGGNLFSVPIIAMVLEPRDAILSGCITATALTWCMTWIYRKNIIWSEALQIGISSLLGIPFGTWFLEHAGARAILLATGAGILLFLAWQYISRFLKKTGKPISRIYAVPFGFISGLINSAVSMGGPPVVLYAFLRRWNRDEILGTLGATGAMVMTAVLPWQYFRGLYTPTIIQLGIVCSLTCVCGIGLSVPVIKRINNAIFRNLMLCMLFFASIIVLVKAVLI